jgi:hypothetical protein
MRGRQPGHHTTPAFTRERARRPPTPALLPWTNTRHDVGPGTMSDETFAAASPWGATAFAASADANGGKRAAKGCWSPRRLPNPRSRWQCPEPTKRPTSFAVGRNVRETSAMSVKSGHTRGGRNNDLSPANAKDLNDRGARLKIVVSPVRVRVSPSAIPRCCGISSFLIAPGAFDWVLEWAPAGRSSCERLGAESQCSCRVAGFGQRQRPHDSRLWCSRFEDCQCCYVGCGRPQPQSLIHALTRFVDPSVAGSRVRLAELVALCRWRRPASCGS